ncbi:MAG TPA: SCO family protein [Terriglobales bacterium]|nr:SCO family protein [Terriglobales bacterium]
MSLLIFFALHPLPAYAAQRYPGRGMVLEVDRSHNKLVVSCQPISGLMDAMVMPFDVADAKSLVSLQRGALIDFVVVVDKNSSHLESVHVRKYAAVEREPSKSGRLQGLDEVLRGPLPRISVGERVPDFVLTDQSKRRVHFSQFAGKVVALNFIYTRCVLPQYCFRSSNNFGVLQKRFSGRLGKDVVLLSISFDPVHDQPEILQRYAHTWKSDPENWRFLTGNAAEVQRVCDWFGVNFVPDEGLYTHNVHTVVIGRDGKLVANLEGNEFTAQQLGDLVDTALSQAKE